MPGSLKAGGILTIAAPDYSGCTIDLSNSSLTQPAPGNPQATAITLAITFLTAYNSAGQAAGYQTFVGSHEVWATGVNTELIKTAPADLGSVVVNHGADFTFDMTPSYQTIAPGTGTVSVALITNAIGGLTGTVNLYYSVSSGNCFYVNSFPGSMSVTGQATMVLINECNQYFGADVTYTIFASVVSSNGTISHTASTEIYLPNIPLPPAPPPTPTPDFVVSVASNQGSLLGLGQIQYPVSVAAVNGYGSSVSLTVSGLPAGASGTFSLSTVTPGQPSMLTIKTDGSVPGRPYPLAVTGTAGYNVHTATFTLPVESPVLTAVGSRTVQNNGAGVNVTFNIAGSSAQPGTSCNPFGNSGVACTVQQNTGSSVTVLITAAAGSPHGAVGLPFNSGAMPAYAESDDTPPQLYDATIPSPTWNSAITVTFSGQGLNACQNVEEGECWWTDIELIPGQSAPGSFGLSDETATSADGLLNPSPSGGTFWFQGNACAGGLTGDGFLGNTNDSCDAGEVNVYVDPEPQLPPPTVTIQTADIVNDNLVIVLSNSSLQGNLTITLSGPANFPPNLVNSQPYSAGTYGFSFSRTALATGEYTGVTAIWAFGPTQYTATQALSFNVLGAYLQTQYNTPQESNCVGLPASAYITSYTNNACVFNSATLLSDFMSTSLLQGNGITITYGPEQNEVFCLSQPQAPAGASGISFRAVSSILPACSGLGLSGTTLAVGADANVQCGDQVLIVGLGGGNAVKTVTDACPACTGSQHFDNYNPSGACTQQQKNAQLGTLGTFTTIRLR